MSQLKLLCYNKLNINKFFMANKKITFQQVMKPGDWIKLGILVVFSVICLSLVWWKYSEPFDTDKLIAKIIAENNQLNQDY